MFQVRFIDSFDDPQLAPYRTMRQQRDHEQQGVFVAEGEKVVRRLLDTDLTVISVLFPSKWLGVFSPVLSERPENIQVFVAEKETLQNLTGFSMYQGVLALARIPPSIPLDQILRTAPRPYFFAAVDALATAENLGGLVRNCAAFGVQALLVGETSSSPYLRRAVRASMGTIFQLPVVEAGARFPRHDSRRRQSGATDRAPHSEVAESLSEMITSLRAHGVRCIAAHPHADRKTVSQANLAADCCIVFGSEGHGISRNVLDACDEAVAIPMPPTVDSLNVGSASAVVLYEACRQRGRM
ncbi:MAG: RNA methyltransferase [Verrucomicrobia bacterium]|nr:RNA methyltransferase [Verrucomicrobiota bacterium]